MFNVKLVISEVIEDDTVDGWEDWIKEMKDKYSLMRIDLTYYMPTGERAEFLIEPAE